MFLPNACSLLLMFCPRWFLFVVKTVSLKLSSEKLDMWILFVYILRQVMCSLSLDDLSIDAVLERVRENGMLQYLIKNCRLQSSRASFRSEMAIVLSLPSQEWYCSNRCSLASAQLIMCALSFVSLSCHLCPSSLSQRHPYNPHLRQGTVLMTRPLNWQQWV